MLRIKKYFEAVNAGKEFAKSDFCTQLLDFIKKQPIVLKDNGSTDIVIAVERSFELDDDSPAPRLNLNSFDEDEETMQEMRSQITRTKTQYQVLLDSGKIKDQRRIQSIKTMIAGLNKQ